ncbi:MAG: hypothetical protein M1822_009801 [Bathelium mastoideum]|nr:MAG: hypothetical protein M1822_009801 [Bathelium mastoideum]
MLKNCSSRAKTASNALLATVQVGASSVDLAFARSETRTLAADLNCLGHLDAVTGSSVVNTQAALREQGNASVLSPTPTFAFPRDLALSPDRKFVLVTDLFSDDVPAVKDIWRSGNEPGWHRPMEKNVVPRSRGFFGGLIPDLQTFRILATGLTLDTKPAFCAARPIASSE